MTDLGRARQRVAVLVLVLLGAFGCGAAQPAQPCVAAPAAAPPPAARASAAQAAAPADSALSTRDIRALVAGLLRSPSALLQLVDPQVGVSLAFVVGCEREDEHDVVGHLCGAAAERELSALHEELADRLHSALFENNEPFVDCNTEPQPACVVNPDTECETVFTLYFAGTQAQPRLEALVGRDDWQESEDSESRVELDQRIERLLKAERRCPLGG